MKVHHWIDKYNYQNSLKILSAYHSGIAGGKTQFYSLNPFFWDKYLIRLLLVCASILTFQKQAYQAFFKLLSDRYSAFYSGEFNPVVYIKFRDLLATLFGFRYFVEPSILMLLPEKEIRHEKIDFLLVQNPEVSIIITNCIRLDHLYNCLRAIAQNTSGYTFEVIVLNHTKDRFINAYLNKVGNLKVGIVPEHVTFKALTDITEKQALCKYICLLNCNIQVKKGWLNSLIKTLGRNDCGAAGSKILSPAGLISNAGYNSESEAIGAHQISNHPYYNYQKEVSFCSSNVLAFTKDVFLGLNPDDVSSENPVAFGKAIGLALQQKDGKKIYYQPLSEVILFNLGKNLIEKFEVKNQAIAEKTILFIDDAIPAPDQDSGSNRIFQVMLLVKSLGYHVVFVPVNGEKRSGYFEQMTDEGFEVLHQFPNRKGMLKLLLNKMPQVDIAWICKPHNNEQFKFIFDRNKNCKWIYDTIDLHFLRMQREAELAHSEALMQAAHEVKSIEIGIARQADITLAITNDEKLILEKESIKTVSVIPNIHEVRVGNETEHTFASRTGLLFIGGYLHRPNIDAAEWLINEIMPIVWKSIPDLKVTLLGSNPTDEVLKLQSDLVLVPGYIHDVSSYFNNSKIFVAPLRFGAGMKGKIGQSLEFGLPIVSTDIGVEGVGLTDNENVLVANETQAFAAKILALYSNEELWTKVRNNSLLALEAYTPGAVKENIKALLEIKI